MEDGQTRWRTDIGVGGQTGAGEQIHADGQALQDGQRYFRMDQVLEDGHRRLRTDTGTGGRKRALVEGLGV